MRIYLVQHGDAISKEIDPARPLSGHGVADTKRVAAFLRNAGIRVSAVIHSGKKRAAQTAEILASALSDRRPGEAPGLKPKDPVGQIAGELCDYPGDTMVVGHQPLLGNLTGRLVSGNARRDAVVFTPGTVVCLEKVQKRYRVLWALPPDLLHGATS
jgi:phosphohistidine phosphatase